ncbi:MAG: hypothetical protein JW927_14020 [Deltaproteobacteria bacterium]|nr:hypothetical protein [Deltaproteobacteria bacterium]
MNKDDNLFEDEIKESSDLLDIGLDDLTDDFESEAVGEETDEGVIDLTDLVEKGDAELFGEDDIFKEDITPTDEPAGFPDDLMERETEKKIGFDDMLLDADVSAPADDLGLNLGEDMPDELLPDENLTDDSGTTPSDTDITGDLFEKLLDDTELEEISDDTDESPEDTREFNLESEDFSDLESVLKEEAITDKTGTDSPAPASVQGNLFRDFDTGGPAPLKTDGIDDEQTPGPDIFGGDLEKTIASSDDDSDNEPLWGTDADINTSDAETEGISILEESSSDDEKIEYSGMDEGAPGYVHLDDIQLDGKVLDTIFPDEAPAEAVTVASAFPDLPQAESQDLLAPDIDQHETEPSVESTESEILAIDDAEPEDEIPAAPAQIMQPAISEERIEEIVTKVVGEVVERVAREVFAEVADRVISEAIEGLKKSLEAESVQ